MWLNDSIPVVVAAFLPQDIMSKGKWSLWMRGIEEAPSPRLSDGPGLASSQTREKHEGISRRSQER